MTDTTNVSLHQLLVIDSIGNITIFKPMERISVPYGKNNIVKGTVRLTEDTPNQRTSHFFSKMLRRNKDVLFDFVLTTNLEADTGIVSMELVNFEFGTAYKSNPKMKGSRKKIIKHAKHLQLKGYTLDAIATRTNRLS